MKNGRSVGGFDFEQGDMPSTLRDAVRELKLRLGHSPLYRVVEIDPWSRIPERRHALLNFDPWVMLPDSSRWANPKSWLSAWTSMESRFTCEYLDGLLDV
jgi:hypothetical protein